MANIVLSTGKGKNKRQWEFTPEEFQQFELMFEENELIEIPTDLSTMKLRLCPPPERTPIGGTR